MEKTMSVAKQQVRLQPRNFPVFETWINKIKLTVLSFLVK